MRDWPPVSDTVLYFDLASPYSYLAVMRAEEVLGGEPELQPVLAAKRRGVTRAFTEAAYLATFGAGGDLNERETVLAAGEAAGIPRDELSAAIADPAVKAELRTATDTALERGVIGVPTLLLRGELYFGDDQLEQAAARL